MHEGQMLQPLIIKTEQAEELRPLLECFTWKHHTNCSHHPVIILSTLIIVILWEISLDRLIHIRKPTNLAFHFDKSHKNGQQHCDIKYEKYKLGYGLIWLQINDYVFWGLSGLAGYKFRPWTLFPSILAKRWPIYDLIKSFCYVWPTSFIYVPLKWKKKSKVYMNAIFL